MGKQFIIAISREFGSGGHHIAEELAKRFGVSYYDHNLLDEIAEQKGFNVHKLNKYDEAPRRKVLSRSVRGYSNSPEEVIAELQFDYLREKAEAGESFVIVGRCAESILADYKGLIPIFVSADIEDKIARIMERRGISEAEAFAAMKRHDHHRKSYHNHFCETRWGDSRAYDLCVNTSALGIEGTTDFLEHFIRMRIEKM